MEDIRDPQVAGYLSSPVVTAYDLYDNIKTDYTGTVSFSSTDVKASTVIPADYTFTLSDNGTKTFTEELKLTTTGPQTVTVTGDGKTGSQTDIDVKPAALSYFTVTGLVDGQIVGYASSPTVTAYDLYDNLKTDYAGTIAFSSSDSLATLPADYTFTAVDLGVHTFFDGVAFGTAGTQTVTVADGAATRSQTVTVLPTKLEWDDSHATNVIIPSPTETLGGLDTGISPVIIQVNPISKAWGFDTPQWISVDIRKINIWDKGVMYVAGTYRVSVTAVNGTAKAKNYNAKGPAKSGGRTIKEGETYVEEIVITSEAKLNALGDEMSGMGVGEGAVFGGSDSKANASQAGKPSAFVRARNAWRNFMSRQRE